MFTKVTMQCTNLLALTGPRSSMGSPMTLMIRPRVSGPTGMRIGDPTSVQISPRTRPSVPSIAIVRHVFSPLSTTWQQLQSAVTFFTAVFWIVLQTCSLIILQWYTKNVFLKSSQWFWSSCSKKKLLLFSEHNVLDFVTHSVCLSLPWFSCTQKLCICSNETANYTAGQTMCMHCACNNMQCIQHTASKLSYCE